MRPLSSALLLLAACRADDPSRGPRHGAADPPNPVDPADTDADGAPFAGFQLPLSAADIALEVGFQDRHFGHFNRGRALVAADFDLDGRTDLYVGNVGDASYVMRNVPDGAHGARFEIVQSMLEGHLSWGAAAADYDNDGDYDLFVTGGGNQCADTDVLFQNQHAQTGRLEFVDVTEVAGVRTWDGEKLHPSANAVWGDLDGDARVDLFVNGYHTPACGTRDPGDGRNTIWLNQGDGTFRDATLELGLDADTRTTLNSTLFDLDDDGDLDLYETNRLGPLSRLWRNELAQTGVARFVDITFDPERIGDPVHTPRGAFASCARDLNRDGWEDLVVFDRTPPEEEGGLRSHAVFLNLHGAGFEALGTSSGLLVDEGPFYGVMGCQLGDLNGDGTYEAFVGNGGPTRGSHDELWFGQAGGRTWIDGTSFVDFPAITETEGDFAREFPYRGHGTAIVDLDGDTAPELVKVNGGPEYVGPSVQEPDRLYRFTWAHPPRFLLVRPVGDGVHVSRDAIGAKVALEVADADGTARTLTETLYAGSCFSAQNGFELSIGLGGAVELRRLVVRWPDGTSTEVREGLEAGARLVVTYGD